MQLSLRELSKPGAKAAFFLLALGTIAGFWPTTAAAQWRSPRRNRATVPGQWCPPGTTPVVIPFPSDQWNCPPEESPAADDATKKGTEKPSETAAPPARSPEASPAPSPDLSQTPDQSSASRGLSGVSSSLDAAPFMIGDLFSSPGLNVMAPGAVFGQSVLVSGPDDAYLQQINGHSVVPIYYFTGHNGQPFASPDANLGGFLVGSGPVISPANFGQGHNTNGSPIHTFYSGLSQFTTGHPAATAHGPFTATATSQVVTPGGVDSPVALNQPSYLFELRQLTTVNIPSPGSGGGVGISKIVENASPMPRDRVFFNYSFFYNTPQAQGGVNVNRFTPGFEKTFLDGRTSFEFRAPFATTLSNNIVSDGSTNTSELQFGNLSMTLKGLLYKNETLAFSTGLMLTVPTAQGTNLYSPDGTQLLQLQNNSVHLMPFIGGLYTPNDRLYIQSFVQGDVDSNGSTLKVFDGSGLSSIGRLYGAPFVYTSIGGGYWVYRSQEASPRISGIAPVLELHNNSSVGNVNTIQSGLVQFGSGIGSTQVTNAVFGVNVELKRHSLFTIAYATPLGGGMSRSFDGELRAFFNYRFGPQTRLVRSQLAQ